MRYVCYEFLLSDYGLGNASAMTKGFHSIFPIQAFTRSASRVCVESIRRATKRQSKQEEKLLSKKDDQLDERISKNQG